MPWNSTWPVGGISVKANRIVGQQNTTYIETTMGKSPVGTNTNTTRDHFWAVGTNEDGRHRFMNSPAFTVGGNPADPLVGAGMDGVLYLKSDGLTPARVLGFYRNAQAVIQYIPMQLTGSVNIPSSSSYTSMVNVPNNCYGEIYMYNVDDDTHRFSGQSGFFKARGGVVQSWALTYAPEGSSTSNALKFGNGSDASGLSIEVRRSDAGSGLTNWNYIVKYWKLP